MTTDEFSRDNSMWSSNRAPLNPLTEIILPFKRAVESPYLANHSGAVEFLDVPIFAF